MPEEDPSSELLGLLDRFDQHIASARRLRYAAAPDTFSSSRWDRFMGRTSSNDSASMAEAVSVGMQLQRKEAMNTEKKKKKRRKPKIEKMAPPEIIDFPDVDGIVEDLRRMAELCVIGENYVTNVEKQNAALEAAEAAQWKKMRDGLDTSFSKLDDEKPLVDPDKTTKGRVFDLFFEQNGLKKIVQMLNGELFQRKYFTKEMKAMEGMDSSSEHSEDMLFNDPILLPPIPIATQALQSVSIMIQNCSRITSLYVILSNNHINMLVDLPLELYDQVDVQKQNPAARIFANPEITELTTHFVTFLKSLAIRINAETLQFFLAFHQNETTKKTTIDFPLYERALKFCVADQDTFVRTTALSICLNTLRLTTPAGEDGTAAPIPWESKLCLAEYACHPARVEHLIAPTFARCALAWSAVDEHVREMDACRHMSPHEESFSSTSWNERVRSANHRKQQDRWARGFRDKMDNLIDELLLLDDIFKVGLTVLNEQLIERMLATFVYPLLMQPLVEYCNQLDGSVDEDRFSFSEHPFGAFSADLSDVHKSLLPVAGPTKAALLTLAVAFQYLSNRPLLRLIYTVLFHPLLPDTSKAPTVRSQLQVSTVDEHGKECIRLDSATDDDDRITYEFGTTSSNRRRPSSDNLDILETNESCTFVLAPALAEVLEFRGDGDIELLSRTRPNPYRRAFLRCLTVPHDMSDVRDLAICTLDAALAAFNQGGQFRSSILYGFDLKRRRGDDDVPADELDMESMEAHNAIDRDLGGGGTLTRNDSHSVVGTNFVAEVISAICGAVATAHRIASDDWKFQYDPVAAHVLLLATQKHPEALTTASRTFENRLKQVSTALVAMPSSGLMPMGGSTALLPGSPSINADDYEDQMYEAFLNAVFYDMVHPNEKVPPLMEEFVRLKSVSTPVPEGGLAVSISRTTDSSEMAVRVVGFLSEEQDEMVTQAFENVVATRRESARVLVQLDAMVNLLKDLAATSGGAWQDTKQITGIVIAGDGTNVPFDPIKSRCRDVYANLSSHLTNLFFTPPTTTGPAPDSVVDLSTTLALFCVCEVSSALSHFFGGEGVESEGITWQSLCLTFQDDHLAFCRPISPTQATVIGCCDMERLSAELDPLLPNATSAARRLGLVYTWFDKTPPPLFLFDAEPEYQDCDGGRDILSQIRPWKGRVDVWFENGETVEQAYEIVTQQCFTAKRRRGQRLQEFLDPNKENLQSSSTFW